MCRSLIAAPCSTLQEIVQALQDEVSMLHAEIADGDENTVDTEESYINVFDDNSGDCFPPTIYRFQQIPSEVSLGIYAQLGTDNW